MNNFYVNGANHISFTDGVVTFHFCSTDVNGEGKKIFSDDFRVSMTINSFNIMMQSCEDFIKKINEIKVDNGEEKKVEEIPAATEAQQTEATEGPKKKRKRS